MNVCMLVLLPLPSLSLAGRLLEIVKLLMLSLVSLPKVPVAAECCWRAHAKWRAQPPHVVGHQAVQKLLTHETVTSGCEILRKRHLCQICIPLLFWYQNNCNGGLK